MNLQGTSGIVKPGEKSFCDKMDDMWKEIMLSGSFDIDCYICGKIIGKGAVILNGYSYVSIIGNITYLTMDWKEMDEVDLYMTKYLYIPDYKMPDYGFENHITTPERTICDLMMYPEKLRASYWLPEILQGYMEDFETPNNWGKVVESMKILGIKEERLYEELADYDLTDDYWYEDWQYKI